MSQAKSQTNMCLANVSSLRSPSPMAPTPPPKKGLFRDKKSGKGAKNGVSTKLPPVTSFTLFRSIELSRLLPTLPTKHTQLLEVKKQQSHQIT